MTDVKIYLTPALDGVASEVGYFYDSQWIKLINMPLSVAGIITSGVVFNGVPDFPLFLRIPSQTVGGITYEEAISNSWAKADPTFTDSITLEIPLNGPPPVESPIAIIVTAATGIALIILSLM